MISRREFIVAACCGLGSAHAEAGGARHRTFLCATPDVPTRAAEPLSRSNSRRIWAHAAPDPGRLWRASDGSTPDAGRITLDVCFLNGSRHDQALVRRIVPQWTQGRLGRRIAFRFDAPASQSQIRVRFRGGVGNLSDIGRDALAKSPHQATVNLDDVTQRPILHEFGHVLGLHHEHQHPASGIVWNKPVVLAYTRSVGWSDAKTEANIFDHLSRDCTCIGDPKPDWRSIMVYPFPADWTLNGIETPLTTSISVRDRRCLEREYGA